jgi:hypothetical protein
LVQQQQAARELHGKLTQEHLRTAFAVTPVLLTNPATGKAHLMFEGDKSR